MKRQGVFLLPLDGMLVHRRSLPRNLLGVLKFLRREECFRNAPFLVRINVDCRPNRWIKVCVIRFLRRNEDGALVFTYVLLIYSIQNVLRLDILNMHFCVPQKDLEILPTTRDY